LHARGSRSRVKSENNISLSQKEILLPFAADFPQSRAPKISAKQKCEQMMEFA
jgi:hypothetical protein